jgi:hypothetical protein
VTMDRIQPLELETEKLRRRLQRERKARIEAEIVAEKGLRELYEKQQQLQLLEAVANAANQAISVADALQFAVRTVCQFTGWQVGHAYLVDGTGGEPRLLSTSIWHGVDGERFHDFYQATEAVDFRSGVGLPGRVLASAAPAWVMDIAQDLNFSRATWRTRSVYRPPRPSRSCWAVK